MHTSPVTPLSGRALEASHSSLAPTIEGVPPSYTIMGKDASRMNYEALDVIEAGTEFSNVGRLDAKAAQTLHS